MTDGRPQRASAITGSVGFTLVELLVVIGIIALLISILLPALNKAREQANTVSCLANMRSLGQAVFNYQARNKGILPPPADYAAGGNFGGSRFRGANLWTLLGATAGGRSFVCPTIYGSYDKPAWPIADDQNRAHYSYKYNFLLAGAETNTTVKPYLPKARFKSGSTTDYVATPMKRVPNASETLLFLDAAQIVAFQPNDLAGSDRGMQRYSVGPASGSGLRTVNGVTHQAARGISPVHGRILPNPTAAFPVLSDNTFALRGTVNICYADGSAKTIPVSQGVIENSADGANTVLLDASTNNGNVRTGNLCILEGTRIDPTLAW